MLLEKKMGARLAGVERLAGGVAGPGKHALERTHLGGRQAAVGLAACALQHGGGERLGMSCITPCGP